MASPIEETATKSSAAVIVGLTLVTTEIGFAPERPSEKDFIFSYDVEIEEPEKVGDDLFAFEADFVIEKREAESEKSVASFSAGYLCGIRTRNTPDSEILNIARSLASTTIWSSFSSLAAIVTSQMNIDFPTLPPGPSKVDLKSKEVEEESPKET